MTLIDRHSPLHRLPLPEAESGASPAERTGADDGDRRGPLRPGRLTPLRGRVEARLAARIFRWLDVAILGVATVIGSWGGGPVDWLPLVMASTLLAWALDQVGLYRFTLRDGVFERLARLLSASLVAALGALLAVAIAAGKTPEPDHALWFGVAVGLLVVSNSLWSLLVWRWRRRGLLTPNIVVVGATETARRMIEAALKTREVHVVGVFDDRLDRAPRTILGVPVLGTLEDLIDHRIMPCVDQVVITVKSSAAARVRAMADRLSVLPNQISLVLDADDERSRTAALSQIANAPMARLGGAGLDARRALVKRLQDLIIGSIALILLAPVMVVVAILIKLDSPGPVFFRQRRHGFHSEEIRVWKFRSMRHDLTDHLGAQQVTGGDARVTAVGRFIRKTSLDELPQLFNVLAGEMSLVGPRPHAVGMKTGDVESSRLVAEYAHRNRMKPGMTGWAAVNGSRGPVDTPELVRRRVALDIAYIERQSFWFDLWIMALTIPCLLGDRSVVR
jgi:Undecaprenyl-phosphate glucose phosphotransferase